jgi:hypothetical protein
MVFSLAKRVGLTHAHIDFEAITFIRLLGAIVMIVLGIIGIDFAARKAVTPSSSGTANWWAHDFLVFLALFWALFPPMWFFTEYHAFDAKAIASPPGISYNDYMETLKTYAEFSAKVWAGFGALYAGLLSQIK